MLRREGRGPTAGRPHTAGRIAADTARPPLVGTFSDGRGMHPPAGCRGIAVDAAEDRTRPARGRGGIAADATWSAADRTRTAWRGGITADAAAEPRGRTGRGGSCVAGQSRWSRRGRGRVRSHAAARARGKRRGSHAAGRARGDCGGHGPVRSRWVTADVAQPVADRTRPSGGARGSQRAGPGRRWGLWRTQPNRWRIARFRSDAGGSRRMRPSHCRITCGRSDEWGTQPTRPGRWRFVRRTAGRGGSLRTPLQNHEAGRGVADRAWPAGHGRVVAGAPPPRITRGRPGAGVSRQTRGHPAAVRSHAGAPPPRITRGRPGAGVSWRTRGRPAAVRSHAGGRARGGDGGHGLNGGGDRGGCVTAGGGCQSRRLTLTPPRQSCPRQSTLHSGNLKTLHASPVLTQDFFELSQELQDSPRQSRFDSRHF